MRFPDRKAAGRLLARKLAQYRDQRPLVLALPRSGVPVAYEVARALGAPLDIVVAQRIWPPGRPELGIGAVAPQITLVDRKTVAKLGITPRYLRLLVSELRLEMNTRLRLYRRGGRRRPRLAGRTVILVDDGLASGWTARAAIDSIRRARARRVVLAVPVASPAGLQLITQKVDACVCLHRPVRFRYVGDVYDDFPPTSDEEVVELLKRTRSWRGPGAGRA